MVEKRKIETMVTKRHGDRREISLSIKKKRNYDKDDIDPNQTNDKYLL